MQQKITVLTCAGWRMPDSRLLLRTPRPNETQRSHEVKTTPANAVTNFNELFRIRCTNGSRLRYVNVRGFWDGLTDAERRGWGIG